MTTIVRICVCAVALVLAGVGLDLIYPSGLLNFGRDLSSLPELRATMRLETERGDRLEERKLAILERLEAKRRIIADLVGNRMSLLEAARRFHELALATPEAAKRRGRFDFQNGEDTIYLCRQVIGYVKFELSAQPEVAATVATRLDSELQQALQPSCLEQPF